MQVIKKIINQKNVDMTFYVSGVSKRNTYRDIEVRFFDGENFINITNKIADELQMKVCNQGVRVAGYGMNMCFALANLITEHVFEKYNKEICITNHDFITRERDLHIDFMQNFAKRKIAKDSESVICNNCGTKFNSDEDLSLLAEDHSEKTYLESELKVFSKEERDAMDIEWIKGCPHCKTDGYLADIKRGDNE